MEDAGDIVVYDEEDLMGGRVGAVAFPGVVKWGEEQEGGRGGGWSVAGDAGGEGAAAGGGVGGAQVDAGGGAGGPGGMVTGGGGAGAGAGGGKPRVLVKARVLCVVPEEPDE